VPQLRRPLPRRLGHEEEASLVEHLTELRTRIIICLGSVVFWFTLCFVFRDTLIGWLNEPLPDNKPLITLGPAEPFTTSFNVCLWTAIALSIPILAWQTWAFLAPAFEPQNQHSVVKLAAVATALLAVGMAFAYFVVLPISMNFLLNFDSGLYNAQLQASKYYGFAAVMIFAMGLVFELPIFVVGLVRLGIVSSDKLRRERRIGYGICIVIGVLLPGVDFVSMLLETAPIVVLFEASIWAAVIAERRMAARADMAPGPV
jgi:sec-independent protein translocase protein TatC